MFGRGGIGDVEDVQTVTAPGTRSTASKPAQLCRIDTLHGERRNIAVLGVVPRGGIQVIPLQPHAIAIAMQILVRHLTNVAHVVRIEDGDLAGTPVARIQVSIAILDALRFVRLAHGDMRRKIGIGDVDKLHAILALAEKHHISRHIDTRSKFAAVEARSYARMRRIGGVNNPQGIFAGRDIGHSIAHRNLANAA